MDENIASVYIRIIDKVASIGKIIAWTFFAFIISEPLTEVVRHLSGEETTIDVAIKWFTSSGTGITVLLSIVLNVVCLIWALWERHLRHQKTIYLCGYIKELETKIDKNRSGSGITPKGTTHPKDE
ncbi:MAG: hypothetical protein HWE30_00485 [Methylocystaceae bacterium]|nr:hypothetical protein [Methylocystaceae bacterium]